MDRQRIDWAQINAHFTALFDQYVERGGSRVTLAKEGKIKGGQSAVSKILKNQNLGPAVETFVKAIEGLGMTVSSFFAQIEALKPAELSSTNVAPSVGQDGHVHGQVSPLQKTETLSNALELIDTIRTALEIARDQISTQGGIDLKRMVGTDKRSRAGRSGGHRKKSA